MVAVAVGSAASTVVVLPSLADVRQQVAITHDGAEQSRAEQSGEAAEDNGEWQSTCNKGNYKGSVRDSTSSPPALWT